MTAQRGYQMGRWLAGRLMKELGLVSCQQPTHRYKRGGHEHVAIPNHLERQFAVTEPGFAPIFPDTCYHLTHYWPAAVDIPVASDNPVHYADAIRYNARTPLQGSLLPLTRLV